MPSPQDLAMPIPTEPALNKRPVAEPAQEIINEVEKAIVGKEAVVRQAVLALLCNGHILIEDIPGVGKTTLAKALARAVGGSFKRVQFTPDLLPTDVTGTSVYNQKEGTFEFLPGPIFGNVVLVDEINRATPKTQSALLEAMEERQVSSDGVTRALPKPFFVIATQNNIDMTGTYPLPEAQLDRFFARISLGYPDAAAEVAILEAQQITQPLESVQAVSSPEDLLAAQAEIRQVHVDAKIREYIVEILRATRVHPLLQFGGSPRGSLHLMNASQANAALSERAYVTPDDVKAVAPMVLAHRVILRPEIRARGGSQEEVIREVLKSVTVPLPVG